MTETERETLLKPLRDYANNLHRAGSMESANTAETCVLKLERSLEALASRQPEGTVRVDEWQPIATAPKDGTRLLLGHWFVDDDGYFGGSRWLWIASGLIDEGGHWCDFTDDQFTPANFHTATHWQPLPPPPAV